MIKGEVKFTIPIDEFGISHVIDKCLCAMFSFHQILLLSPRAMRMMATTILLDLFIKL